MTAPLLDRLADHVCGLSFADIPGPVVQKAKDHVVNHFGLALRGRALADGRAAVEIARLLGRGAGESTVIGERWRAPALEAAFANCTLMRAEGQDDVLFPAGVHAALVTMPVAFALGEQERRSGQEVLTAIVAGYDLVGKLGNVVWAWAAAAPRRPTIPFGPFGAVAVAARLLGLDREQTARAIGYAANCAMGLAEGDLVTHYYSLVCRNGILSALLARAGGRVAPTTLDGDFGFYRTFFGKLPAGLDGSVRGLGTDFEMMNATTKRYPGTALNVVPIELMLEAVAAHRLCADDVRAVTVFLPRLRENFAGGHSAGPFTTRQAAVSSVLFALAIAILDGRIALERYERPDDERVAALVRRMRVVLEERPRVRYARLEIETASGERIVREGDDHVFPRADRLSWLRLAGDSVLPEDHLVQLGSAVAELEHVADVRDVMRWLVP